MKNMIIKETGNSRYLKSSIPADITFAQLVNMLREGTFPIDLNGINPAGIAQQGTALNKENLLSDAAAAAVWDDGSVPADPTPGAALQKLGSAKANSQQSVEDAGKFWRVGENGELVFENPIAKFSQGPVVITETQVLDMTQYGLKVGDQINLVVIGGGGGGGYGYYYDSDSENPGGDAGQGGFAPYANYPGGGGGAGGGYGAGGGGGGGDSSSDYSPSGGGGGGGGYLSAGTVTLTETSVAVTIGAGGNGAKGIQPNFNASAGGTTSFGTLLSAAGGAAGENGANGNAPKGGDGGHKGGDGGVGGRYGNNANGGGGGGGGGGWIVTSATVYAGTAGENGVDGERIKSGGGAGGNGGTDGSNAAYNTDTYAPSAGYGHGAVIFWY